MIRQVIKQGKTLRSLVFCAALFMSSAAVAAQDSNGLVPVMAAVRADEWAQARQLAQPLGQVARDIVEWRYLRAGEGQFSDYLKFLERRSDWPDLARVRARAEESIRPGENPDRVIAFFAGRAPLTGAGAARLVEAFDAKGLSADAEAQAVLTWRTLPLMAEDHARLLSDYARALAPHHVARADALLWSGQGEAAKLVLPLLPDGHRKLTNARLTLRANGRGVDTLIAAVPRELSNDAGLAYERFNWRYRKGRYDDAAVLLDERSVSLDMLGRPAAWSNQRRIVARQMMRDGKAELAYRLAANHFLTTGSDYADLEWLAGYIALRKLREPQVALSHFKRFEMAVETPISMGRAGYWEGLAYEALGDDASAQVAYGKAALHQTSFYGQLAAERAGLPTDPALAGGQALPDWRQGTFMNSSVLEAALLFSKAGERNLAEWFLTHLAENGTLQDQKQLVALATAIRDEHIALRLAKVVAQSGDVMQDAYFPLTDLARARHPVPTELVLSIARRESEFDPAVTSGVGARGLMQLMPGTAKEVAGELNMTYSTKALLDDPKYNATLGAAYLDSLIEEFGNNYILVSAAYNAGPSRVRRWLEAYGDPRGGQVDPVDWIEHIPFRETRNYVMRVMESLAPYRARLDGKVSPLTLSRELRAR